MIEPNKINMVLDRLVNSREAERCARLAESFHLHILPLLGESSEEEIEKAKYCLTVYPVYDMQELLKMGFSVSHVYDLVTDRHSSRLEGGLIQLIGLLGVFSGADHDEIVHSVKIIAAGGGSYTRSG